MVPAPMRDFMVIGGIEPAPGCISGYWPIAGVAGRLLAIPAGSVGVKHFQTETYNKRLKGL